MSTVVTLNGQQYTVPAYNDTGYAQGNGNLSLYLVAISTGTLQATGGLFQLTADADFGPNFGLKALYLKSETANIAATGVVRLAKTDAIVFRNNANNADLPFGIDSSDRLTYNSVVIATSGGVIELPNGTGSAPSLTFASDTGTGLYRKSAGSVGFSMSGTEYFFMNSTAFTGNGMNLGTAAVPFLNINMIGQLINTNTSNQIVLGTTNTATISSTAPSASRVYTIPDPGASASFVMTQGAQTIVGALTLTAAPVLSALTATTVPYLNASKVLTSSAVTPTQLGFLDATSSIQTQLNLLAPLASPTFTGTITTPLTASFAVVSNASSQLGVSTTTLTELSYVHGVTSAIQTQMDLKAAKASPTFTGTVVVPTPFTLGAISVTATGTELNYVAGVTSAIQTQLNLLSPLASPTFTGTITAAIANFSGKLSANASAGNPIHGTNTNDNASAGYVGEYIESVAGPVSFATSGQYGDLTSITLTAGDWDVTAVVYMTPNGATMTADVRLGISTTSGNSSTGLVLGSNRIAFFPPTAATDSGACVGSYRISVSGSTIVYEKFFGTYSVATPQAYGRLSARRVR